MEYLYFPMSSLNLSTALTHSALLPPRVFGEKPYGATQMEDVEPNPDRDLLIFYDRPVAFSILDHERENYPINLKILKKDVLAQLDAEVRLNDYTLGISANPVYLNLGQTKVLFANEQEAQALRSSLGSLLEVKFSRHVVRNFAGPGMNSHPWRDADSATLEGVCQRLYSSSPWGEKLGWVNHEDVDRILGLVLGYVCGAYLTCNSEVLAIRSELKQVRQQIHANLNARDSRFSIEQKQNVENSLNFIVEMYAKSVSRRQLNFSAGDGLKVEKGRIAGFLDASGGSKSTLTQFIELIDTIVLDFHSVSSFRSSRQDLSVEFIKAYKQQLGSRWESNPANDYLTQLYHNLNSGQAFQLSPETFPVLSAFAAVFQRGDTFDDLESHLVRESVGDMRFAFALLGAINGFSRMPRTLTDRVFDGNEAYASQVLDHLHSSACLPLVKRDKAPSCLDLREELPVAAAVIEVDGSPEPVQAPVTAPADTPPHTAKAAEAPGSAEPADAKNESRTRDGSRQETVKPTEVGDAAPAATGAQPAGESPAPPPAVADNAGETTLQEGIGQNLVEAGSQSEVVKDSPSTLPPADPAPPQDDPEDLPSPEWLVALLKEKPEYMRWQSHLQHAWQKADGDVNLLKRELKAQNPPRMKGLKQLDVVDFARKYLSGDAGDMSTTQQQLPLNNLEYKGPQTDSSESSESSSC